MAKQDDLIFVRPKYGCNLVANKRIKIADNPDQPRILDHNTISRRRCPPAAKARPHDQAGRRVPRFPSDRILIGGAYPAAHGTSLRDASVILLRIASHAAFASASGPFHVP